MWRRYLMWFAHEHVDMRLPEIKSIVSMYKIPIRFLDEPHDKRPYWVVELPGEECALQIASRSVSLRNCIELWSWGKTAEQLHANLQASLENKTSEWVTPEDWKYTGTIVNQVCPNSFIRRYLTPEKSFKIQVETFGNHLSMGEKIEKIESFSYLPLEGRIDLKKPDVLLMFLEHYTDYPNNNTQPEAPVDLFFGRWVADGQRERIKRLSLKRRKFIGNTSMDAQLSLLMANQARVESGDLVLDPFVGSGSLLVAAAEFGGYVMGSDIDFMMLHGRTRPTRVKTKVRDSDESVRSNMRQYGLESRYLDVVVSDFATPLLRPDLRLDAIVTDPPYGVREPTERIGIEKENYTIREEHLTHHVPSKVDYDLSNIYTDLLNFSARHLRLGGRLVVWYPVVRDDYDASLMPSHPCLQLVADSEQVLSAATARRLLTYEKSCHLEHSHVHVATHRPISFREKYFDAFNGQTRRKEKVMGTRYKPKGVRCQQ